MAPSSNGKDGFLSRSKSEFDPPWGCMNSRIDYQEILNLRLQGKTYGEIKSIFNVPKSTLSSWFSKLVISKKAKDILKLKRKNGYLKLVEFNKVRTRRICEENESIRKNYETYVDNLNDRELMILGAALYWGEGYKNFKPTRGGYPYICFGNSDPKMVLVFIKFMEKVLGILKDKMRVQIMIYPGIGIKKVIDYWQGITKISRKYFRCQVALSRASQGKRPKHLLPYGTFQVRVTRRQEFFKIRGLIDGIIKGVK